MRHISTRATWLLCAACAAAVVCFSVTGAPAQQLAGKGEWQSLSGGVIKGTWSATLLRKSSQVQGDLKLTGSNVFTGGSVSGDVDSASIMLGVVGLPGAQGPRRVVRYLERSAARCPGVK
jgi:hypothetical protein